MTVAPEPDYVPSKPKGPHGARVVGNGRVAPQLMVWYECSDKGCVVHSSALLNAYDGPPSCRGSAEMPHAARFMRPVEIDYQLSKVT